MPGDLSRSHSCFPPSNVPLRQMCMHVAAGCVKHLFRRNVLDKSEAQAFRSQESHARTHDGPPSRRRRVGTKLPHTLIPIVFVKLCPPRTDGSFLARDTSTHTQLSSLPSLVLNLHDFGQLWSSNPLNCTSYHAGIHVIETAAKVVFAAVLGSIPVPVPGTWCVLYEYQIRGILLSPTWYIRVHSFLARDTSTHTKLSSLPSLVLNLHDFGQLWSSNPLNCIIMLVFT